MKSILTKIHVLSLLCALPALANDVGLYNSSAQPTRAVLTGHSTLVAEPNEMIHHTFKLNVDRSVIEINNVRYLYGDRGWRVSKRAGRFPIEIYTATMTVPEVFEISWDAGNGQHYAFKIPVRSKIHTDLKNKDVLFVIASDHVEGFVVTTTMPNYQESLERFH